MAHGYRSGQGDSLQPLGLLGVFPIATLLRVGLGRWAGPVLATVWLDVSRRGAAQRRAGP